jgi:electron transport complex protein RnfC
MLENTQKLGTFPGGVRLEAHKSRSTQTPIARAPIPKRITLPLQQHIGEMGNVLVKVGDYVYKGQPVARAAGYISARVHASSSGTVVSVSEQPLPHPSGLNAMSVIIETDGRDEWLEEGPQPIQDYQALDPADLRIRVRECGIVGLGGAAFPASVKLTPRLRRPITTVILNGVECESYISCDDMLMRERPEHIIEGLRIIRHALQIPESIIAIEENMPSSLNAMRKALGGESVDGISIVGVPAIYPAGGERQLVTTLTGEEVPSGKIPLDIGILCQNVATASAVYQAVVRGRALVSRIVTVTGDGVSRNGNLEVLLGTPIAELIEFCGGYTEQISRLIMGGPMMGFSLSNDQLPVIKATNCLLAASHAELGNPQPLMPCIRCGECARVCPARLLPQELYRYAKARDLEKTKEYSLPDCIECGCCAYVCPSNIPLVQYYRFAKDAIAVQQHERYAADLARRRYEHRQHRLQREQRRRNEKRAAKKAALDKTKKADDASAHEIIKASLQRAAAKKKHALQEHTQPTGHSADAPQRLTHESQSRDINPSAPQAMDEHKK